MRIGGGRKKRAALAGARARAPAIVDIFLIVADASAKSGIMIKPDAKPFVAAGPAPGSTWVVFRLEGPHATCETHGFQPEVSECQFCRHGSSMSTCWMAFGFGSDVISIPRFMGALPTYLGDLRQQVTGDASAMIEAGNKYLALYKEALHASTTKAAKHE